MPVGDSEGRLDNVTHIGDKITDSVVIGIEICTYCTATTHIADISILI